MFGEFEVVGPIIPAIMAAAKAEPVAEEDTTEASPAVIALGAMSGEWLREFTVRAVCGVGQ